MDYGIDVKDIRKRQIALGKSDAEKWIATYQPSLYELSIKLATVNGQLRDTIDNGETGQQYIKLGYLHRLAKEIARHGK